MGLDGREGFTRQVSTEPLKNKYRPFVEPKKSTYPEAKVRDAGELEREITPPTDDEIFATYSKSIASASLGRLPPERPFQPTKTRWGKPLPINLNAAQSEAAFAEKPKEPKPAPAAVKKSGGIGRHRATKAQLSEKHQKMIQFVRENPECPCPVVCRMFKMDSTSVRAICEREGLLIKKGHAGPKMMYWDPKGSNETP